jgi:hypothetical protein
MSQLRKNSLEVTMPLVSKRILFKDVQIGQYFHHDDECNNHHLYKKVSQDEKEFNSRLVGEVDVALQGKRLFSPDTLVFIDELR